jgi:heat shock protein HslJ
MRRLALILTAALMPNMSLAQTPVGIDWQLLAIDGVVLDMTVSASLRIEEDGRIGGEAPCNSWSAQNGADLPALSLKAIRATRMACDKLAEEKVFFDTLSAMTEVALDGDKNLVLTGPDGRSMEFVTDRMNSLTTCKTCSPKG